MDLHAPISARATRWLLVGLIVSLFLTVVVVRAYAAAPVTRNGVDYSGLRNPGGCEVLNEGTALHVKCTRKVGATGGAYVRYRFLKDVGGVRDLADISADITTWVGDDCFARWMVPQAKNPARTLRVTVPFGSYCHINSVTWSQS